MDNPAALPPQIDDEKLVAYLDGELPVSEKAVVEDLLRSDAATRQRLSALQATWNFLDDLPQPPVRPELAQSTIEMVTHSLEREKPSWLRWVARHRWLSTLLGCLLLFATGSFASQAVSGYLQRQLLADLPAIVEYRRLQHIDSFDFLLQLVEIPQLVEAAGNNSVNAPIGDGQVPTTLPERHRWVKNLQEVDKGRLENNLTEYTQQSEERKAEIRRIAETLYRNPQESQRYLAAIRAYNVILSKITAAQKVRLQLKDVESRIAEVKERVNVELALGYTLSAEDASEIRSWLDEFSFNDDKFTTLSLNPDVDWRIITELLYTTASVSFVTEEDVDELIARLSPSARSRLEALRDEGAKRFHLGMWVSSVVQGLDQAVTGSSDEDIARRFDELPAERQDEFELLPAAEVRDLLLKSTNPGVPLNNGINRSISDGPAPLPDPPPPPLE